MLLLLVVVVVVVVGLASAAMCGSDGRGDAHQATRRCKNVAPFSLLTTQPLLFHVPALRCNHQRGRCISPHSRCGARGSHARQDRLRYAEEMGGEGRHCKGVQSQAGKRARKEGDGHEALRRLSMYMSVWVGE